MLKINGVPIEDLYELEIADAGDTRQRAVKNSKYIACTEMAKNNNLFARIDGFKINGVPLSVCAKGSRPRFTLRHSIKVDSNVKELYLVSLKSGAIWITSSYEVAYQREIESLETTETQFEIIPASVAAKIILIEAIAGGGGGSGGGTLISGGGGGSGGMALLEARIDDSSFIRCEVGNGGEGCQDLGQAAGGERTYIAVQSKEGGGENYWYIGIACLRGEGANKETGGSGGQVSISRTNPQVAGAAEKEYIGNPSGTGQKGGDTADYKTYTFEARTIECGLAGESQCSKTYGAYSVTSNACGAGANSFFGAGAKPPEAFNSNGTDATAYGAGGSGGAAKAFSSTKGGRGADGIINIYY